VNQLRRELAPPLAPPTQAAEPVHENGIDCQGNETILPPKRNQAETDVCSVVGRSNTGFDHGGVHHQPVLSAVLQGSAIGHPNAEPDPALRTLARDGSAAWYGAATQEAVASGSRDRRS